MANLSESLLETTLRNIRIATHNKIVSIGIIVKLSPGSLDAFRQKRQYYLLKRLPLKIITTGLNMSL
jgi:hypothetical protein